MRPIFLPRTSAPNTHPGVTTQPGTRSKGSIAAYFAIAAVFATSADATVSAFAGNWMEAAVCVASCATILVGLGAWHDFKRYQRAERWRQAVQRRDELQRQRAEAVRLHRSVKAIDAELQPLTARMSSGAI